MSCLERLPSEDMAFLGQISVLALELRRVSSRQALLDLTRGGAKDPQISHILLLAQVCIESGQLFRLPMKLRVQQNKALKVSEPEEAMPETLRTLGRRHILR